MQVDDASSAEDNRSHTDSSVCHVWLDVGERPLFRLRLRHQLSINHPQLPSFMRNNLNINHANNLLVGIFYNSSSCITARLASITPPWIASFREISLNIPRYTRTRRKLVILASVWHTHTHAEHSQKVYSVPHSQLLHSGRRAPPLYKQCRVGLTSEIYLLYSISSL